MEDRTMAAKRPRKATAPTPRPDNLARPSAWRLQHGGFNPPGYDTDPDTGMVVTHHRAVDTLGQMLAHGTITQPMHDAGTLFRRLFRAAALGAMGASALARLPGKTTRIAPDPHPDARRKIAAAIDMLGGHDSPAGSCAWHVLGCECSVREWAMRQGWGGRVVSPSQAQGMLVATLSVLAAHFGLQARPSAA
jgi:hypothetical protein